MPRPTAPCPTVRRRHGITAGLILALTALAPASQAAAPSPGQAYQLAREARTAGDYAGMLAHWRAAAQGGHVGAQEMLASVLLAGPALYGDAVPAQPCEAAYWARQAAAQGSPVAAHQRAVLDGLRALPSTDRACVAFVD